MNQAIAPDDDEEASSGNTDDVADSDLIAAAEAAIKGEGADAAKDRDEQGRFLKGQAPVEKPKAKEAAPEKPSSIIARELAKREAARAEESQFKGKLEEVKKAHAEVEQLRAQLQTQAAEVARERQQLAEAKRDPGAFLKQQGWSADQFIDNAVRAKDPAYQESVALREVITKQDGVIANVMAKLEALEAKAKSYDEQGQKNQQAAEVQEFWTSIPKDSPVYQDYDDRDDILYRARKVRQDYFDKTGKVASPKEIGEYLHYKALEKRAGTPAQPAGSRPNAGKTKAKVPRALGGSDASERRAGSGAKHIHDMTPDEEREYLMDVAAGAVTGSGD